MKLSLLLNKEYKAKRSLLKEFDKKNKKASYFALHTCLNALYEVMLTNEVDYYFMASMISIEKELIKRNEL